jgi:hypothetical protein
MLYPVPERSPKTRTTRADLCIPAEASREASTGEFDPIADPTSGSWAGRPWPAIAVSAFFAATDFGDPGGVGGSERMTLRSPAVFFPPSEVRGPFDRRNKRKN